MNVDFTIKVKNTLPIFVAIMTQADPLTGVQIPLDLTTATSVTLRMRPKNGNKTKVVGLMTKDPDQVANIGKVSYTFSAADTAVSGLYYAEYDIVWSGGGSQTIPGDKRDNTVILISDKL